MPRLTATFRVPLSSPILARIGKKTRTYEADIDGFRVKFNFVTDGTSGSKYKKQHLWTRYCEEVEVSASRDENDTPPGVRQLPNGTRDLTPQSQYFSDKIPAYRGVALRVLNNVVAFFKYTLRQPLLAPYNESTQALQAAKWTDASGSVNYTGPRVYVVPRRPGGGGELGVIKFERQHEKRLTKTLASPSRVSLHEELLSDAQAAAFEGNIRRAVLELAVSCEVFVKHPFFDHGSRAAQVVEAMEGKGKISIRVLELLDIGTAIIHGMSFKDSDKAAYQDIDHLFRARNKVAHQGKSEFRDDKGSTHVVDVKRLSKWWQSVGKLFSLAK